MIILYLFFFFSNVLFTANEKFCEIARDKLSILLSFSDIQGYMILVLNAFRMY